MTEVKLMMERAQTLKLDAIVRRAQRKHPYAITDDLLKQEYLRFFVMALTSLNTTKFPCRPPSIIDIVWHEHILFTKQYEADCKFVGGQFLHHTPESSSDILSPRYSAGHVDKSAEERLAIEQNSLFMLSQYKALFGEEAPSAIWPKPKQDTPSSPSDCITCG